MYSNWPLLKFSNAAIGSTGHDTKFDFHRNNYRNHNNNSSHHVDDNNNNFPHGNFFPNHDKCCGLLYHNHNYNHNRDQFNNFQLRPRGGSGGIDGRDCGGRHYNDSYYQVNYTICRRTINFMKCMAKNIKKTFIFKYQGDACNMRIIILHCDW